MKRRCLICFSLAVATCLASAQGPDIARDFVLTDKEAVGMLSPRVVCGSLTLQLMWSPDGSVLLARRMDVQTGENVFLSTLKSNPTNAATLAPPPPTQELIFYSPKTGKVRSTVPIGDPNNEVFDISWVPGSQQILVEYERVLKPTPDAPLTSRVYLALVSYDGRVTPLVDADANTQNFQTSVSPNRPLVAVLSEVNPNLAPNADQLPNRKRNQKIQFYNSSGRLISESITETHSFVIPQWGSDGNLYLLSRKYINRKPSDSYRRVDLSTAKVSDEVTFPGDFQEKEENLPVQTIPMTLPLRKKEISDQVSTMILVATAKHEETEFAIVSSDSKMAIISPSGESVAYVSRGVALIRPLAHIPKEMFLQARAVARRQVLLNQGKQVGLGFMMFAGDNDDVLPANGADLQKLLGPYLKDNNQLTGFVYSFAGGNLTDVQEPASTVLGYLPGEGGQAIVYVDGHVKWKSGPP